MADIKYKHAYIENDKDNIISIDDITNENRKQHKYYCIGCGHELLPRAIDSKHRAPHFYHREVVNCSGETYLHKLTKSVLKQKFDNENTFFVEYNVTKECSNTNCKYRNLRCREDHTPYKIDLKKFYDTCTEETTINGFIADLLLTNSKNPETKPTLIEVCVSHSCDDDKRNSGLRIIEVKIKDEQDINILRNWGLKEKYLHAYNREINVEFINFKREITAPHHVKLQRYIYKPQQNPIGYLTAIDCKKANERLRTDSLVELNVVNTRDNLSCDILEVLSWMSKHKGIRRCILCKFYYATIYEAYPICRLSKKYGKPAHPSMDEAEKCKYYQFRQIESDSRFYNPNIIIEEVISRADPKKPEYKVILAVSRSFEKYDFYKERILFYLSEIMKTHTIVVIVGAYKKIDNYTNQLCEETGFIKESYEADWGKYGQEAVYVSNDKMINSADALIAFWDGRSLGIKDLIEKARKKNIWVAVEGLDSTLPRGKK